MSYNCVLDLCQKINLFTLDAQARDDFNEKKKKIVEGVCASHSLIRNQLFVLPLFSAATKNSEGLLKYLL